jgi:ectoine hydroxylase-related dioxygenase (phytanoyl-CoA dioxygenase family)
VRPEFLPGAAPNAAVVKAELERDGYVILRGVVPTTLIEALGADLAERFERTPFCDGDFYGHRTKRFGGVLKRSAHAEAFVRHPLVLAVTELVLGPWCDRWQLNLTQALQIHPGQAAQPPHRDEDMWRGAKGETEYLINVMWPFSRYTAENGATLVFPGSQNGGANQAAPAAPIAAEMEPGDVLLFLGSTLHGGGANVTDRPRTGLVVSYSLGWLKPYENQWLVYPPEVARQFSPELAALVGYQQHRPNIGNVEGQCPSVLLRSEVDDYRPAVDALLPEQAAALAAFVAQRAALAETA